MQANGTTGGVAPAERLHPTVDLRPVHIPATVDSDDGADFRAIVAVRNTVYAELCGNHDEDATPEQLLPTFTLETHVESAVWSLRVDGEIVGRVLRWLPQEPGSQIAHVETLLLRAHWGTGLGSAAHEHYLRDARAAGRSIIQTWAEHPADPTLARVTPPTGFGSVPEDHAATFLTHRGYRLEQVERKSVLDLRASRHTVDALLAECVSGSPEYRPVRWLGRTPTEYVDGFARLRSRMSTDAPSAGMAVDAEVWDASRVAEHDEVLEHTGDTRQIVAIQHLASGDLVAFNELSIGKDHTLATHQGDTLVLREHRGKRLGMYVKTAGLVAWREVAPDSPRVLTWNAEENRHMLSVNEAIGFTPAAYIGAWRLDLT